jgi:hypothetical protein
LNEGEQRGNLFVIQGISTARIGEVVRGTTDISRIYGQQPPFSPGR